MSAKHTPGPWLLSPDWRPNPCAVVDTQSVYAGPRIGVLANVVMAAQDGQNLEERAANARLIAAAPELLEAAQLVIGSLSWNREDEVSREVMRRLTAAIAKSEGK